MEKRTNVLKRNRLADELLRGLSKEEQIKWLVEKLAKPSNDGGDELDLLEGLEMIFGEDKIAFRKQLRHIYDRLTVVEFPKLAVAIAEKILEGWNWTWWDCPRSEYYKRGKKLLRVYPDAKDCFRLFCQICGPWKAWLRPLEDNAGKSQIRKRLIEVFHEHINTYRVNWCPQDLNEWILAEDVPEDIRIILAGARVRMGRDFLIQREVSLSQAFQTQDRSPEALALVAAQMEAIKRTEELTQVLVEKVRPRNDYGDLNPETVLPHYIGVQWKLESANVAYVQITFHHDADLKSIVEVQAVRDQLLSTIESPPRILIEVEGPAGFNHKEE